MTKAHYVYTLCFPCGTPFYVGKGRGDRMHAHEVEARNNQPGDKCEAIRKIWASGGEVIKNVVFTSDDALTAYREEMLLIQSIGLENLTNHVEGGVFAVRLGQRKQTFSIKVEITDAHFTKILDKLNVTDLHNLNTPKVLSEALAIFADSV